MRDYYERVRQLCGFDRDRPYLAKVMDRMGEEWSNKNIFVIEAPTGYGKSSVTASLALKGYQECGKVIVAYPLRTLLEEQFTMMKKVVKNESVIGKRYMHEHTSPYLIKPVTLTTIDTLSLTMFGLAPEDLSIVLKGFNEFLGTIEQSTGHYLYSWSSVALSDIVLDEVHLLADETKSLTYLLTLLIYAISHDMKVIVMSATLPNKFKQTLLDEIWKYSDKIEWFDFDERSDEEFLSDRSSKNYKVTVDKLGKQDKHDKIFGWIKEGEETGFKRILVIFNTVGDAVEFYEMARGYFKNLLLLHSRFTDTDKRKKAKKLEELKNSSEYLIIGTQSIEAGVSISSNLIISELAPANTLVQRFGRFLRYEGEVEGLAFVWFDDELNERENYKVYDARLCIETLNYMGKFNGNLNLHFPFGERGYKQFLDTTYADISFRAEREDMKRMLTVFTDLDKISKAVELFLKMQGSFIRESLIVPVQVEKNTEPIPISYDTMKNILRKGIVKGILKIKSGSRVEEVPVDQVLTWRLRDERALIRLIYRENVLSFLVQGEYCEDSGLKFEEG